MTVTVDSVALTAALDRIAAVLDAGARNVEDARATIITVPDVVGPNAQGDAISVPVGGTAMIDLLVNDHEGSAPFSEVRILTPPTLGTFAPIAPGTPTPVPMSSIGAYAYAAGPDAGPDTIVYQDIAQDGGQSMPATLAITVTPLSPPPPPPPPPLPTIPLLGFHGAMCRDGDTASDVIAAATGIHQALTPRATFPKVVAVWFAKNDPRGSAPGWGNKADTFQRLTDQGARALVAFPPGYIAKVQGAPANTSIFEDIVAGRHNSIWDRACEWMDRQGQHSPIIRLVEPGLRGSFPWGIGNSATADFSDCKAAYEYFFKHLRSAMPGAHLVISHFRQPNIKTGPTSFKFVHPDMYSPDPLCYDGDHVDVYDDPGETMTAAKHDAMMRDTTPTFDGKQAPHGLDTWAAYAKSRHHTCGVDECGIRCNAGDPPERDNAFFAQALDARAKKLGLMHCAWFRPGAIEHKMFPTCNLGTTRARDAFMALHNVAG